MKSLILALACVAVAAHASAQTATTRSSVREAYGARLNGKAVEDMVPANRRLATRIDNQVNGRLATRIERYEVNVDPTQALVAPTDDRARIAPRTIQPVPQAEDDPLQPGVSGTSRRNSAP